MIDITIVSILSMNEREWGYRIQWNRWYRMLMLGFCINIKAPALTIWILGLNIWVGNIPVEPITHTLKVEK